MAEIGGGRLPEVLLHGEPENAGQKSATSELFALGGASRQRMEAGSG